MKRKITCILAADVVEFSRLVAEDEEDTLARLVSAQAVFGAHVTSHGGRIFNTAGDAILAEFPSAVEAVRAALTIQDGWGQVDSDASDSRRLWFRMGIGIGDVVEHGTDLLGDGVNIAARLQGLAPPGGLAVSNWVQEQIAGKVNQPLIDIGEQDLKNIPKPVRVSVIDPAGQWLQARHLDAAPTTALTRIQAAWVTEITPGRLTSTRTITGVAAALIVALSALVMLRPKRQMDPPSPEPVAITQPAPLEALPTKAPDVGGAPVPVTAVPVTAVPVMPAPQFPVPLTRPAAGPVPVSAPEAPPKGPTAAPPIIIDPPDFAGGAPLRPVPDGSGAPAVVPPGPEIPGPETPGPETLQPKRMPIRVSPPAEIKRMPSIEKKPAAK